MTSSPPDLLSGSVVFDRFRLCGELGSGGMGQVWEAEEFSTGRCVALKVLPPDDHERRERFLREGRTLERLRHSNVLEIEEVLEEPNLAALVMERLEGETLGDRMEREPQLPWREVQRIGRGLAHALVAAHAAGIVHRDVKPENVFLLDDGGVKLIDFGIALGQWGELDTERLTQTGTLIGTPIYMSPEQLLHPKELGAKTDIWSLGVLIYECVAGVSPTMRENAGQVFQAILAADFPPLEGCPPALAELVAEMLAKTPADRPTSRAVFERLANLDANPQAVLSHHLRASPEPEMQVTPPVAPRRPSPRIWRTVAAVYAALILFGAFPHQEPESMAAVLAREGLATSLATMVPAAPPRPEPVPAPHEAPPSQAPTAEAPPTPTTRTVLGRRLRGRSYRPIERANPYR